MNLYDYENVKINRKQKNSWKSSFHCVCQIFQIESNATTDDDYDDDDDADYQKTKNKNTEWTIMKRKSYELWIEIKFRRTFFFHSFKFLFININFRRYLVSFFVVGVFLIERLGTITIVIHFNRYSITAIRLKTHILQNKSFSLETFK